MDDYYEPAPVFWIEEGNGEASTPRTRKYVKKKREYVGWASRELIEFLESIGKDTSKALSQSDVASIVDEYVNVNKLINPLKKKRVLCDEKLQMLFGKKKSVYRNKIHDLLDSHLVENQVDSDDNFFGSSDENDKDEFSVSKKLKILTSEKKSQPKKKAPEASKSSLAAINAENMKLVYLRRSLVQELLKNPDSFESKVVGSFVRVKADPYDIFQKNSHQLQLVTGVIGFASSGDNRSTLLQISGMTDDISIAELSDENFSEEEVEDLHRRVKDGLLKQPNVGELEQKLILLHEDITKHWLARELVLLRNLIDRACEKGWRHKVAEYLDKKKLLESPAEQSRLFNEIPKVMPDVVKPETIPESFPDDSPKAADWDWEPYDVSKTKGVMMKPEILIKQDSQAAEVSARSNGDAHPLAAVSNGHAQYVEPKKGEAPYEDGASRISNGYCHNHADVPKSETLQENNGHLQVSKSEESEKITTVVIDLSDDDDDGKEEKTHPGGETQVQNGPYQEQLVWHYFDPHGRVQGPFSLTSLKRWSDSNYFPSDFKVWLSGRSHTDAVPLSLILQQFFPN